jgi:hypothetical protein
LALKRSAIKKRSWSNEEVFGPVTYVHGSGRGDQGRSQPSLRLPGEYFSSDREQDQARQKEADWSLIDWLKGERFGEYM